MSDSISLSNAQSIIKRKVEICQFDDVIEDLLLEELIKNQNQTFEPILTKKGLPSKRKRTNYTRRPKKSFAWYKYHAQNPWETHQWLRFLRNPAFRDPTTTEGKWWHRKFRVPPPVFDEIILLCRQTGEHYFCYAAKSGNGSYSTPLELKVLVALRVLAGGLMFEDAAEQAQMMSEQTVGDFFKGFCRLFRRYYEKQLNDTSIGRRRVYQNQCNLCQAWLTWRDWINRRNICWALGWMSSQSN